MDSSVNSVLSDQSLNRIRTALIEVKQHKKMSWDKVALDIDPKADLKNVLTNFVTKEQVPRIVHLRKYISYLEKNSGTSSAGKANSYTSLIEELFGSQDRYLPFKEMLAMSEDEQQRLSSEMSGIYFAIRKNGENKYVVSHIKIANTYSKHGLAICSISRKRLDGLGDLTIDGSVCKKNQHVYVLGYEKPSGHVRTIQLTPIGEDYKYGVGLTSGFDTSGVAFSARIAVVRSLESGSFQDTRDMTGIFAERQDVINNLVAEGLTENDILAVLTSLEEHSFITATNA